MPRYQPGTTIGGRAVPPRPDPTGLGPGFHYNPTTGDPESGGKYFNQNTWQHEFKPTAFNAPQIDDPAKMAAGRAKREAGIANDPRMHAIYADAARKTGREIPAFSQTGLTPEQQQQMYAFQGKGMWQDAVNKQQLSPGKGGSQPTGGLGVTTPGIPAGDSPYWAQQAQQRANQYAQGLGGGGSPAPIGSTPPGGGGGGGGGGSGPPPPGGSNPPPSGGLPAGSGITADQRARNNISNQFSAFGGHTDPYGNTKLDWDPMRDALASHTVGGQDSRVWNPAMLSDLARQVKQNPAAAAQLPDDLKFLANAPDGAFSTRPQLKGAASQWFEQAAQMRGNPGGGAQPPGGGGGGGAQPPPGGGGGGAQPPPVNPPPPFQPPASGGSWPPPWGGAGPGGPWPSPYGPPLFPLNNAGGGGGGSGGFMPPGSGGGGNQGGGATSMGMPMIVDDAAMGGGSMGFGMGQPMGGYGQMSPQLMQRLQSMSMGGGFNPFAQQMSQFQGGMGFGMGQPMQRPAFY